MRIDFQGDQAMSSPKPAPVEKVGVQISKETGGAYADIREIIESELARIKEEWANKHPSNGTIRDPDQRPNGHGPNSQ